MTEESRAKPLGPTSLVSSDNGGNRHPDEIEFSFFTVQSQIRRRPQLLFFSLILLIGLWLYAWYQPFPRHWIATDTVYLGTGALLLEKTKPLGFDFYLFWFRSLNDDAWLRDICERATVGQPTGTAAQEAFDLAALRRRISFQIASGQIDITFVHSEPLFCRGFLTQFSGELVRRLQEIAAASLPAELQARAPLLGEARVLNDQRVSAQAFAPPPDWRRRFLVIPLSVLALALLTALFLEYHEKASS